MWYKLNKFEALLLFVPFLIYARLRHIPYSARCGICGKRLFNYFQCYSCGLCDKHEREQSLSGKTSIYEVGYQGEIVPTGLSADHLYVTAVKKVVSGKVLDIGCGYGFLLSKASLQPGLLYGMDVALGALKVAKDRIKEANFCQGDARILPFKSGTFDCVVCTEVLEHIEGDDAIKECYRVLKPRGVALFTTPNKTNVWGERVPGHIRPFSFHAFASFVQGVGFEIISSRKFGLYIPFVTQFAGVLSFIIGKNLPLAHPLNISVPECLSTHFFIEARKSGQAPHVSKRALLKEGTNDAV